MEAKKAGVNIIAYDCQVMLNGMKANQSVEVYL